MKFKSLNQLLRAGFRNGLIAIFVIIFCGMFGYRFIEGWSWSDSLYMTVLTVSTVGLREVHPLSFSGRLFTILLIVFGSGFMAYCVARIVELLFQRSLSNALGRKNMMKKIAQLKDHVILCGYGRTGSSVATELQDAGKPFVVVENNEEIVRRLEEQGLPHVAGDASEESVLEAANVAKADSLVAALESDAENLFLTLTSGSMNPGLRIIVRVHDPDNARKFRKAGASRVVSPIASGANQIAQLVTRPAVVDLVELVTRDKNVALQVFEHPIEEGSEMAGKTIAEARLRQALGCMVIAIKHPGGHTGFDPGPDVRLHAGDVLVAIRRPEGEGD